MRREWRRSCGGASRGRQACSSTIPAPSSPSPSDAPTRSLTLLIGAERSRTEDEIEFYPDGYASERGGLVEFVSAELRYAFFANRRVSPYAVVGTGRGVERPNVNELFPHGIDRKIVVIYYGAGARIPVHRRLDAFADWRLIVTGDDAAEMAVLGPLRGGITLRF
jgi:hypothetical protein